MIGVILWSDKAARKAVVWCEDQGDLAFLDHRSALSNLDGFFDVGDIIRFKLSVEANLRRVHNATLLEDQDAVPCAKKLKPRATPPAEAKIIPFRIKADPSDREEKRNAQGAAF